MGRLRRDEDMTLDAKVPSGPIAQKWEKHKFDLKLVNPANKRKYENDIYGLLEKFV